ncbi:hypothetical protein [Zooshikella ganghwensis]|uniref:hypothetical protein n=1 Tax=Zooshikella ganghwensis TaxID=202772 RepID=UPI001BAEF04E|nr:hypothetical protein [Zooshikella ganghwensis]
MKKLLQYMLPSVVVAGAVFFGQGASAALNDEIAERIKPVGEVCLEGEECAKAAAAPVAVNDGPRSGRAGCAGLAYANKNRSFDELRRLVLPVACC